MQAALQTTVSKVMYPSAQMPGVKLTSRTVELEYKNQREMLGQTPPGVEKIPVWELGQPLRRVLPGRDGALQGGSFQE